MDVPTQKQIARRNRIEEAAYAALEADGYRSASLLSIAQRASVSNETLYRWYGSKQALFRALVERNAEEVRQHLETALTAGHSARELLTRIGPVLLTMVTSERAVSLNRAAAGDVTDTGVLGRALAEAGRDTIAPLLARVFATGCQNGEFAGADPAQMADIYIRLLIGDLQVRRATGAIPPLTTSEIENRAANALALFIRLFGDTPAEQT